MEVENIKVDDILPTRVAKKRSCNDDSEMQVDEATGIEGAVRKSQPPKAKRIKSEMRKIAVPPHR